MWPIVAVSPLVVPVHADWWHSSSSDMVSLARWIRKSLGGGHSRGIRMVADIQVKSRYGQPRNDGFRNLLVVVIVVVSEWGTCSGALMVDKDVTHMESLRLMVSLEKPLYSTVRGQPLKPLYNQGCLGPASPIRRRLRQ